jgi:hypothetical protein
MTTSIQDQLVQEHASLICEVVQACEDDSIKAQLLDNLTVAEENGWRYLCAGIRKILDGARTMEELDDMDVEDEAILQAIIAGLEDPSTLPRQDANANPMLAPAGIAGIIRDASHGEENALHVLARMDADLQSTHDPELMEFASVLRRLLNGERHTDTLTMNLNERTTSLVSAVVEELERN